MALVAGNLQLKNTWWIYKSAVQAGRRPLPVRKRKQEKNSFGLLVLFLLAYYKLLDMHLGFWTSNHT